jgi:hypothetical protein
MIIVTSRALTCRRTLPRTNETPGRLTIPASRSIRETSIVTLKSEETMAMERKLHHPLDSIENKIGRKEKSRFLCATRWRAVSDPPARVDARTVADPSRVGTLIVFSVVDGIRDPAG